MNMTVANRGTMAVLSAAKGAFTKNAIREISSAQTGKRLLNLASIFNLLGVGVVNLSVFSVLEVNRSIPEVSLVQYSKARVQLRFRNNLYYDMV